MLVVIDDAQWVDDESAVALSFVGRRLHSERVASLLTMRDTPDSLGRFEGIRRIALGGLSAQEAHELLTARAGGRVDELVADHIVGLTGGNPLAFVELPAVLTVEQLRGTSPLPDPLPIGERLSGLFASRLAALDANARTVLLLASAERLGDPTLLRRAADAVGGLSWDEARHERRGQRARRIRAQRRVPPSARPIRRLLLGRRVRSSPRARRARGGARW